LGSNIDPEENLRKAHKILEAGSGAILRCSSVWESISIGFDGPNFLNVIIEVESPFAQRIFKEKAIANIEKELERVRTDNKNSPRTIDIDILIYNSEILDSEIWEYAHIAAPLSELLPDLINPQNQKQLKEILTVLVNQQNIIKRSSIQLYI